MQLERAYTPFLALGGTLAAISSILYVAVPRGTIQNFGGIPTESSIFWTRIAASGDILVAYLCYRGITDKGNKEVRNLVLRALQVYGVVHFGLFMTYQKTPIVYAACIALPF